MGEMPMREPEELRQSCVAKLKVHQDGEQQTAVIAFLVGETWTEHGFVDLAIDWNGDVLGRRETESDYHEELCPFDCLVDYVKSRAVIGNLDGDEFGYLLGQTVAIKRTRVVKEFL